MIVTDECEMRDVLNSDGLPVTCNILNYYFCLYKGLPVLLPKTNESVLLGSAILGASASGNYDNIKVTYCVFYSLCISSPYSQIIIHILYKTYQLISELVFWTILKTITCLDMWKLSIQVPTYFFSNPYITNQTSVQCYTIVLL